MVSHDGRGQFATSFYKTSHQLHTRYHHTATRQAAGYRCSNCLEGFTLHLLHVGGQGQSAEHLGQRGVELVGHVDSLTILYHLQIEEEPGLYLLQALGIEFYSTRQVHDRLRLSPLQQIMVARGGHLPAALLHIGLVALLGERVEHVVVALGAVGVLQLLPLQPSGQRGLNLILKKLARMTIYIHCLEERIVLHL